jgi:hypothetical protein
VNESGPANAVTVTPDEGGPFFPIQIVGTHPKSITLHSIWDYELDNLTGYSRPVTLAVSATLVGAFLGLIPSASDVIGKVSDGRRIDGGSLVIVGVWGATILGGLIAGFFAVQGQMAAQQLKATIRARTAVLLNPRGHAASASGDASPSV